MTLARRSRGEAFTQRVSKISCQLDSWARVKAAVCEPTVSMTVIRRGGGTIVVVALFPERRNVSSTGLLRHFKSYITGQRDTTDDDDADEGGLGAE